MKKVEVVAPAPAVKVGVATPYGNIKTGALVLKRLSSVETFNNPKVNTGTQSKDLITIRNTKTGILPKKTAAIRQAFQIGVTNPTLTKKFLSQITNASNKRNTDASYSTKTNNNKTITNRDISEKLQKAINEMTTASKVTPPVTPSVKVVADPETVTASSVKVVAATAATGTTTPVVKAEATTPVKIETIKEPIKTPIITKIGNKAIIQIPEPTNKNRFFKSNHEKLYAEQQSSLTKLGAIDEKIKSTSRPKELAKLRKQKQELETKIKDISSDKNLKKIQTIELDSQYRTLTKELTTNQKTKKTAETELEKRKQQRANLYANQQIYNLKSTQSSLLPQVLRPNYTKKVKLAKEKLSQMNANITKRTEEIDTLSKKNTQTRLTNLSRTTRAFLGLPNPSP